MIEAIIFDNDGTLYNVKPEFHGAVVNKFCSIIEARLGMTRDAAVKERQRIYKKHGSTVAGIVKEYGWDPASFVQDTYLAVPLEEYVEPNTELARMLADLSQRKVVLTNNPSKFARRVLERVGIENQFEQIFGEEHFDFELKPNEKPYELVLRYFENIAPSSILMVEDTEENLKAAERLGIKTCIVRTETPNRYDFNLSTILALGGAIANASNACQ